MRHIPLRVILVIPFVLQICAAVGITGWMSLRHGEKAVRDLTRQLRLEVSARIVERLKDDLNVAPSVTRFNVEAIASGAIDANNPKELEDYLIGQLKQFPSLTNITIATEQPNYIGVGYDEGNRDRLYLSIWNPSEGGTFDWAIDKEGKRHLLDKDPTYDHRQRPWYRNTIDAGQLIWNQIYLTVSPQELVISTSQPFYNATGKVLGVVSIDLSLRQIAQFLKSLQIGKTGKAFIIDRDGKLIASSGKQKPYRIDPNTQEPERILAIDSSDPLISASARKLHSDLQSPQQIDFTLDEQPIFAQITPFSDRRGIDWIVVTVLPESDFMEAIHANTRLTIALCSIALVVGVGTGILTSGWIVRPLFKTIVAADALSQGNWQKKVPEAGSIELALLGRAFNRMAKQLQESFTQLEYSASHDDLTALPNRQTLLERLTEAIEAATLEPSSLFALLFLDLDFFKFVNDSFGHLAGDCLLVAVARRLQEIVRPSDTVARFGGDEFILLLRPVSNISEIIALAEQILASFQSPFDLNGNEIFISTSIGIVLSTMGGKTAEDFLRNADLALYRAKDNGKNNYEVFTQQMHDRAVERLQLETDLRRALEREEFELYYQPIFTTSALKIEGFEALIRWHHPVLGIVSPNKFIPLVEETGLIIPLGWWVLQQACRQMKEWRKLLGDKSAITMSVNITSHQFSHPNLVAKIEQILAETQLSPRHLKLEITESALLHGEEVIKAKLSRLRSSGIQLSLDDFGTGYSSLSYLHRFPIDTLKIDRAFIINLEKGGKNVALLETIILLARQLNMKVVAEGVETQKQLEILRKMGCEGIQGYLFSPPVPAIEAAKFLIESRLEID